ncbi:hypothetical protein [Actinocatenispora rupis]|uniref:Uncharacterized protein n=1 Tax=Actinocatenispora rupis TaxID=519421 RepID=A0A8J3JAV6_9ACTN|nr:hypothetical protein [Actinocatenispora rupis]GID14986.1 hypothetical protein Aru02nite_58750 [Actinocatenispora rupis]
MGTDADLPVLTTDQADRLRAEARAAFARRGVDVTGDGAELRAGDRRFPLHTVAQKVRQADEQYWPQVIDAHVGALFGTPDSADDLTDDDLLAGTYLRLLPDDFAPDPAAFRYVRPVAAGLVAALAVDLPQAVQVLDDATVARLDADAAWAAGHRNLAALPVEDHQVAERPDGARIHLVNGASMFVASMALTLPDLLRRTTGAEPPADGVLVAVPWRHHIAFHPIVDATALTALNDMTAYAVGAHADNPGPLSPRLYWWHDGTLTSTTHIDDAARTITPAPPAELIDILVRLRG